MDKKIIQAVAGSGKTTYIINALNLEKRFLIITYTDNNYSIIKNSIIKKYGFLPENIEVYTFFTFLYNFAIKPQENGIKGINYWRKSNGIDFKTLSKDLAHGLSSRQDSYYMNKRLEYYHFRMSKLILERPNMIRFLKERLEKHFDYIYIDESQDLASYDFDLLLKMSSFNVHILVLGDFYQHTFDTSNDGNKNKGLYDDFEKYKKRFKSFYEFDETSLEKSYRCSQNLCEYVENKLGITMKSHGNRHTDIREIVNDEEIIKIVQDANIVKLFYRNHKNFSGVNSDNWGNSKGSTFENVCVVINKKTYKEYASDKLTTLNPQTLRKFYVAVTRTKNSLFFIEEEKLKKLNFFEN